MIDQRTVIPNDVPVVPDANRPAERWFLAINEGDTPANNPVVILVWLGFSAAVSVVAAFAHFSDGVPQENTMAAINFAVNASLFLLFLVFP